VVICTGRNGQL